MFRFLYDITELQWCHHKYTINILLTILQIYFHSDINGLHKHINPEYLPYEYGGKDMTIKEINGEEYYVYF